MLYVCLQGESGLQEDPVGSVQDRSQGGSHCEPVQPIGLALLHPLIASENGPSFTRLLGNSRSAPPIQPMLPFLPKAAPAWPYPLSWDVPGRVACFGSDAAWSKHG